MTDPKSIEVFESMVVKSDDITITLHGDPDGALYGKTSDQILLICSDVLRQAAGESTLEETIEIPEALKQTLSLNYGWTDIEINQFIKIWRKNLYLMKIGKDSGMSVDLEEYTRFVAYLEKKKAKDLDEISPSGDGTLEDEFVASVEEREMAQEIEKEPKPNTMETASVVEGEVDNVQNLSDIAPKPRQIKKK